MTRAVLIFTLVLCGPAAAAEFIEGDHLVPMDAALAVGRDYLRGDEALAILFKDIYAKDTRVITVPSFEMPYALGLGREDNTYEIIFAKPQDVSWHAPILAYQRRMWVEPADSETLVDTEEEALAVETALREALSNAPMARCTRAIDAGTCYRIERLWYDMLMQTRFEPPFPPQPPDAEGEVRVRISADGTGYYFSQRTGGEILAGQARSPSPDANTGLLVGIADAMTAHCLSGDETDLNAMIELMDTLTARLR